MATRAHRAALKEEKQKKELEIAESRSAIVVLPHHLLGKCLKAASSGHQNSFPSLIGLVSNKWQSIVKLAEWLMWYDNSKFETIHAIVGRSLSSERDIDPPSESGIDNTNPSIIEPSRMIPHQRFPTCFNLLSRTKSMPGTSARMSCFQNNESRTRETDRSMSSFFVPHARLAFLLICERNCTVERHSGHCNEEASLHLYSTRWPQPAELLFASVTPEAAFTVSLLFTSRMGTLNIERNASTIFNVGEVSPD